MSPAATEALERIRKKLQYEVYETRMTHADYIDLLKELTGYCTMALNAN